MNMIIKSIYERQKLEAVAYNALKDFKYYKNYCPKEAKIKCRIRTLNALQEYNKLRGCFDNYKDKTTLKRDKQINDAIKCFNISTF